MIKQLFHLSDIHIRNGDERYCRFYEYKNVFTNLFNSIKKDIKSLNLKENEYIIIITGDIFHNKNNIGNHGLMLYKILIENLTEIGLTIILEGNHDSLQHEINQPSLVTSTININNLIILNETKSFIIDNIGFSYVNIRDTLDNLSTSGRKNILKPFPIINEKVDYKIALFHGTFANVKLYNGTEVKEEYNPYPFEWIKDFDYALLGDIHLRQKNNYKELLWCYSGSLIQQNYGEDIIDHGYVIWDIYNKNIKERNIYNEKGYINIIENDNNFYIRLNGKYNNILEDYIKDNKEFFPLNLEIKLFSDIDFLKLNNILNKYNIKFNILSNKNIKHYNDNTLINNNIIKDENIYVDKENMLMYFKNELSNNQYDILLELINNNEKLLFNKEEYPEDLYEECIKKNKDISILINNCNKNEEIINKFNKFKIKYLEWNNLYCYEDINWIDFNNLSSSTFIVSGKNGIGKSAIYDILTLAIWGEITKDKQSELSSGIINSNHTKGYTIIDIEVNNNIYRIERTFNIRKDTNLLHKHYIYIYKYLYDNNLELIKKNNACKEFIENNFGKMDLFLASSMITQNFDFNLLKMNYKSCTELIDKATNIEYIYNLFNLFKSSLNKYRVFLICLFCSLAS